MQPCCLNRAGIPPRRRAMIAQGGGFARISREDLQALQQEDIRGITREMVRRPPRACRLLRGGSRPQPARSIADANPPLAP